MDERRRYPRLSANFSLEVKPSSAGSGENISRGGLLFQHPTPIAPGAIVDLAVRVPSLTGTIDVKGKVVRCDRGSGSGYQVAVNFVDLDAESESTIREILETYK